VLQQESGEHTQALVSGVQRSNDPSLGPTVLVRPQATPVLLELQLGRKTFATTANRDAESAQRLGLLTRGSVQSAADISSEGGEA
jgi:hypothetical protein